MNPATRPLPRISRVAATSDVPRRSIVLFIVALSFGFVGAIGASSAVRAETIDDVFARCPTPAEIAAIDAVMTISIEGGDPTGPTFVCTIAGGSQNMTKLRRNAYNVLRAAQKIRFSQPLPWSNQTSVWDWLRLESGVNTIRLRADLGGSFCCEPPSAIDIQVSNNILNLYDKWVEDGTAGSGLAGGLALIVHEARHHNAGGHTCGTLDQTIEELGAWGAQYYFYLWLDRYSDHDFLRPNTGDPNHYRNWHIQNAEDLKRLICHPPQLVPATVVEFYNNILNHYFMTISAAEAAAIDNGSAGPGWSRTGITFTAWPSQQTAPANARPVCRFYGSTTPGPNSHFYTVEDAECAFLKQLQATTPAGQPRWNYEGIAFYVGITVRSSPSATDFVCASIPQGTMPKIVNRFYNNRAQFNDSNHRYTATPAASNQMIQQNWNYEGIAMCGNP